MVLTLIIESNGSKKEQNSWRCNLDLCDNYKQNYSVSLKIPVDMCENLTVPNFLFLYNYVKNLEILITHVQRILTMVCYT
jgi:hypothetical protein